MGQRRVLRTTTPISVTEPLGADLALLADLSALATAVARSDSCSLSETSLLNTGFSCSATQATGTGVQRIQDLSGSTLTAKIAAASAGNKISFDTSSYTCSDFATLISGVYAGIVNQKAGVVGTGIDNTVLSMVANTSTRSGTIPADGSGGTNQLYLMFFDQDNIELSCFTLQGTTQGGTYYNGIRLHGVVGGDFWNLKLLGAAPGYKWFPPGETFAINDYQGRNNVYRNIEIDGTLNGTARGATAFGTNSTNDATFYDCYGHNNPYSAAFALWQGSGTFPLIRCSSDNNRTALNIERMGQEVGGQGGACTINAVDFTFGSIVTGGQDIYLGNDRGSTHINIYDPVGRNSSSKIQIYFPATEQGNTNIQVKTDVKVFTGGTWSGGSAGVGTYTGGSDVSATYLHFFGSGA